MILMKKIVLIFLILITNVNASEISELLLNSPKSLDHVFKEINIKKATKYKGHGIHINFKANPDLNTLRYYFYRDLFRIKPSEFNTYYILPSQNPYEFEFETIENKSVKKQLKTKAILSYLYFEDGKIIIDEISPKERLGKFINNKTKFRSNSMGKSLASYVLGNAICGGYIDSVDSKINDWDLVKNTLYENQRLIDLLNMASGDQKFTYGSFLLKNKGGIDVSDQTMKSRLIYFQNTKPTKKKYNYAVMNTDLIFNYVLFKTGENGFQTLLNKIFKEKVKIKESVHFMREPNTPSSEGDANNMFYATRFDYLRIAKAIMDDYQNDTCVGKYLKEIYSKRIPKSINPNDDNKVEPRFNRTSSYGGQFHLDYPGLKDKIVFGMGGYGGKAILIDVEDSRIVVLNSLHYNNDRYKYNHKKLLIDPIKYGKKSFK